MYAHILHHILHLSPSKSEAYHAEPQAAEDLPNEHFARSLMNHPDFKAYVAKHGYHFTCSLADYITKNHLENADGTKHNWTSSQVKAALEAAGMTDNPLHMTWGDAAYLANMAYADSYPEVITTEEGCLIYAYKMANDKDGYEGMAFARWLSDVVAKEIDIDWKGMS